MSRSLLTGNAAAAHGARLAGVDYVPAFPITPQTEILETLGRMIERGEMDARLTMLESEHSMVTAAGAAAMTGVRVFTATSSQGLLYAMEMLYATAGWRAPFVLVNVSRGLASPITLESDHDDAMAARDSGFLQIHAATCQEVLDLVLLAYRVAEDAEVRMPVMLNLDGFHLSFTREPVDIPSPAALEGFLGPYDAGDLAPRASRPVSQAVAVLAGSPYSYFRYEMHLAAVRALAAFDLAAADFAERTGRRHAAVERWRSDDAEIVFVVLGSFATKARAAVESLRAKGRAVGLVRPLLMRPLPEQALREALEGKRAAIVLDQDLSIGKGGVLQAELASALFGRPGAPLLVSFIGGLGGRDVPAAEFHEMVAVADRAIESGAAPPPRLLFTEGELREVRKLQALAHVERERMTEEPR